MSYPPRVSSVPAQSTYCPRYVDAQGGPLHLLEAGEGQPVLLMHWVPLSGQMYVDELDAIKSAGLRALAIDLPGFGQSFKPVAPLTFEQHACCVAEVLDAMGIERCAVLGGHFSAPVAIELACTQPERVSRLILDGCAHLLPPAAQAAILEKMGEVKGPGLHEDGSHQHFLWDQAVSALKIFNPDFELDDRSVPRVYRFIRDYLATGPATDFASFQPYPIEEQLARVQCPTLVLSAEEDPLRPALEPTLLPLGDHGRSRIFSGVHPLHAPERAGEYGSAIAAFVAEP